MNNVVLAATSHQVSEYSKAEDYWRKESPPPRPSIKTIRWAKAYDFNSRGRFKGTFARPLSSSQECNLVALAEVSREIAIPLLGATDREWV